MKGNQFTAANRLAATGLVAAGKMPDSFPESIRAFRKQHPSLWKKEVLRAERQLQSRKVRHLVDVVEGLARRGTLNRIKLKDEDRASSWLAGCEPPEHTLKGIRTATALAAAGLTWPEIAARMGVTVGTIHYFRDDHAETWRIEYDRAMLAAVTLVQSQAGTDAVLTDPAEYIRRARAAQRWTKAAGCELFPLGDAPTISSFYRSYYLPVRLSDAAARTKEVYEGTIALWAAVTGDPPLNDISCEMLARFRGCLQRMQGIGRVSQMSPNTIRKHLKHLQILLDKAGPPGYRNRDAAGIISTSVPWIKPPRAEEKQPRFVAQELLGMAYDAAVAMEEPRLPGIKAPAWWKALLAVCYCTQLRRRTLFEMRMDEIDWRACCLNLPPCRTKSHRPLRVHLNEVAMRHLRSIRTDRELVFPWPRSPEYFHVCFHRLQEAAAIPRREHFGLHCIRKTVATILWEESPSAAAASLDHRSMNTTLKHYVNATSIVARALDALPQPAAFVGGGA